MAAIPHQREARPAEQVQEALQRWAGRRWPGAEVSLPTRMTGGASKETWKVEVRLADDAQVLILRRHAGGPLHAHTLSLEDEFHVIAAAAEQGVRVPRLLDYLEDIAGCPGFLMEYVAAEGAGRRIVRDATLAAARASLPVQMADALAGIHKVRGAALTSLVARAGLANFGAPDEVATAVVTRLEQRLDASGFQSPAIEFGLAWMRGNLALAAVPADYAVLVHGDFRIGNLLVNGEGLAAVIDWETAHAGSRYEDLAWPMLRTWRFGRPELRLGGIDSVEPFLARYESVTGFTVNRTALDFWELAGNVRWAITSLIQARRYLSGTERAIDLLILGRLAAEIEYEILDLIERIEASPSRSVT